MLERLAIHAIADRPIELGQTEATVGYPDGGHAQA